MFLKLRLAHVAIRSCGTLKVETCSSSSLCWFMGLSAERGLPTRMSKLGVEFAPTSLRGCFVGSD